jgi:hypothetical protein
MWISDPCSTRPGARRPAESAGVVIRPRSGRRIVGPRWRQPTAASGRIGPQDHVVENDLLGVVPALWLLLVLVLTALGVVAHASFA